MAFMIKCLACCLLWSLICSMERQTLMQTASGRLPRVHFVRASSLPQFPHPTDPRSRSFRPAAHLSAGLPQHSLDQKGRRDFSTPSLVVHRRMKLSPLDSSSWTWEGQQQEQQLEQEEEQGQWLMQEMQQRQQQKELSRARIGQGQQPCIRGAGSERPNGVVDFLDRYQSLVVEGGGADGDFSGASLASKEGGREDKMKKASLQPRTLQQVSPRQIQRVETEALLAFKARNIDLLGIMADWDPPENPNHCEWTGITCKGGRVTDINLFDHALSGKPSVSQSIPPEISNLTELSFLDLTSGGRSPLLSLSGQLPEELFQCQKLRFLYLSSNRFFGPLPGSISKLANLEVLDLSYNAFSGPLPPSIGMLSSLSLLSLDANRFEGLLPAELGNLTALQALSLKVNNFSGSLPESLSKLKKLSRFNVRQNSFDRKIPAWVFKWPDLMELVVDDNFFSELPDTSGMELLQAFDTLQIGSQGLGGEIPSQWLETLCKNAPNLRVMRISDTNISGSLPSSLASCKNLMGVDFSNNKFSGQIPAEVVQSWAARTSLMMEIYLSNNSFSGRIPQKLADIPCLSILDVTNNSFSGSIPKFSCRPSCSAPAITGGGPPLSLLSILYASNNNLSGFISLDLDHRCSAFQALDLSHNVLAGKVPGTLLAVPALQGLSLESNRLTGPLPVPINCSALVDFKPARNFFTGRIPARKMLGCTSLSSVNFSQNLLTGPIPDEPGLFPFVTDINLSQNNLSGPIPNVLLSLPFLTRLVLSNNRFSGGISHSISQLRLLRTLDVSSNALSGSIPSSLGSISFLQRFLVSRNLLSGPLPPDLATPKFLEALLIFDISLNNLSGPIPPGFSDASPSTFLNFSSNNFSGPLPPGLLVQNRPDSTFLANPGLCGGAGYPSCPSLSAGASLSGPEIAAIVLCVVVGLLVAAFAAYLLLLRRQKQMQGQLIVFENLDFLLTPSQLVDATEGFSEKHKLGQGGFGAVYRATFQNGCTLAVKRLLPDSSQGEAEFEAEIRTLGSIRHRNLVTLVAACICPQTSGHSSSSSRPDRLLIYNFLPGGSLDDMLSKGLAMPMPKWELRKAVALDVARGMKYLHHDCSPRIVHRDIKPANVLLDENFNAFVADFGLAKEMDLKKTHMSAYVVGTVGYLAPEYINRGRYSAKSDVYAYGMILLQLVTGKKLSDPDVSERGLARWVDVNFGEEALDSKMETGDGGAAKQEAIACLRLGLVCTSRVAADRPSMAEVVHVMENLKDFAAGVMVMKASEVSSPTSAEVMWPF